jgi:hypothetical protein
MGTAGALQFRDSPSLPISKTTTMNRTAQRARELHVKWTAHP